MSTSLLAVAHPLGLFPGHTTCEQVHRTMVYPSSQGGLTGNNPAPTTQYLTKILSIGFRNTLLCWRVGRHRSSSSVLCQSGRQEDTTGLKFTRVGFARAALLPRRRSLATLFLQAGFSSSENPSAPSPSGIARSTAGGQYGDRILPSLSRRALRYSNRAAP